jgi:aminoglycoside phosphotransferase (APT) family kinase protein
LTLAHGDYHLANIGTREMTDEAAPVIGDWASCSCGPPQIDLAHFLNVVEGIQRETPSREAMVSDYISGIGAAVARPRAREEFEQGIVAATFLDDIDMLSRLLQDWEGETSWRSDIYYSGEDEVALRAERCLRILCSQSGV